MATSHIQRRRVGPAPEAQPVSREIAAADGDRSARFREKVVIVTGASAGIGLASALLFAREGAQLVLNARGARRLQAAQNQVAREGPPPAVVRGDAADRAVIRRLVTTAERRFGRIDILVNNAGGGSTSRRPFSSLTERDWREMLRANLQSAFFLSQAVVRVMKRQGRGRIVNVASLAGRQRSRLSGADYASAKAGLLALTRHLAWECGPFGITVNAVAPGVTQTKRIVAKWRRLPAHERAQLLAAIPLRRLARPEEAASAIAFLASDDASYITGATLDVNGGCFMG